MKWYNGITRKERKDKKSKKEIAKSLDTGERKCYNIYIERERYKWKT